MKKLITISTLSVLCLFLFITAKAQNSNSIGRAPVSQINNSVVNKHDSKDITATVKSYVLHSLTSPAGQFSSYLVPDATETSINGSWDFTAFPMAMKFTPSGLFVIRNDGQVSNIDTTTGVETIVGIMTGIIGTPTGLAYNSSTGVMYVVVLDGSNVPHFGSLDFSTLTATEISTGTGMTIAMDFANDGFIYAPAIDDDNLYKIDPATGVYTLVGPLGFDLNYGQDISFDFASNTMYGMLYVNDGVTKGILASINIATGAVTQLANPVDQFPTFAIPNPSNGVNDDATIPNTSIYPNPTKNTVNVDLGSLTNANIYITSVVGDVIDSKLNVNGTTSFDLSNVAKGTYIVKIAYDNVVLSKKITVIE